MQCLTASVFSRQTVESWSNWDSRPKRIAVRSSIWMPRLGCSSGSDRLQTEPDQRTSGPQSSERLFLPLLPCEKINRTRLRLRIAVGQAAASRSRDIPERVPSWPLPSNQREWMFMTSRLATYGACGSIRGTSETSLGIQPWGRARALDQWAPAIFRIPMPRGPAAGQGRSFRYPEPPQPPVARKIPARRWPLGY